MEIWQLNKGQLYEVAQAFHDFDESTHQPGERWYFEELNYMPKSGFYFLFVKEENDIVKGFRLFDNVDHQKNIIQNFMKYLRIVEQKK